MLWLNAKAFSVVTLNPINWNVNWNLLQNLKSIQWFERAIHLGFINRIDESYKNFIQISYKTPRILFQSRASHDMPVSLRILTKKKICNLIKMQTSMQPNSFLSEQLKKNLYLQQSENIVSLSVTSSHTFFNL